MCRGVFLMSSISHLAAMLGFETNNKYRVLNGQGMQVYFMMEGMSFTNVGRYVSYLQ